MIISEINSKDERISGHISEAIDDWVLEDLSSIRRSARSDRIRDLMYEPPVKFIFNSKEWDYCLDRWLRMDRETRDEWIEYYLESKEQNVCEEE